MNARETGLLGRSLQRLYRFAVLPGVLNGMRRRLAVLREGDAILRQIVNAALEDAKCHTAVPVGRLRFSVILPVRDRPGLLVDAVASVLAQSWQDFELIIVDDGSAIPIEPILGRHFADPRILVLRRPPLGVSAARNAGLAQAGGDVVAYLDSDNVWLPNFLADLAHGFTGLPEMRCAYGVLLSECHGRHSRVVWDPFDRDRLEEQNFIDLNAFAHRRDVFEELGGFDEALERLVDWDLILRYTAMEPAVRLPAWAAVYRCGDHRRITTTVPLQPSERRIRAKVTGA